MGGMCSKSSAESAQATVKDLATKPSGENQETPPSATQEPESGIQPPSPPERKEETVVAIDEEEREKQLAEKAAEDTAAEVAEGAGEATVIQGEKVIIEADGTGQGRMRVSVTEAVVGNDIGKLLAGASPEEAELLEQARAHVQQGGEGPVVTDVSGGGKQTLKPSTAAAYGYLLYMEDKGGRLVLFWSKNEPSADELAAQGQMLLSFVPALHKTVPRMKYEQKGGKTDLLTDISAKWGSWKASERQKYYSAWASALKVCDEYEAKVNVAEWTTEMPPPIFIALLHTGPVGNKLMVMQRGLSKWVGVGAYSQAAVVPADKAKGFKPGLDISEKKFQDMATEAGGAYLRLSRRGSDAALGQNDLVEWFKEDGIEVAENKQGISLDKDNVLTYERRSADKRPAS